MALHRLLFGLGKKSAQDSMLMRLLIFWHVPSAGPSVKGILPIAVVACQPRNQGSRNQASKFHSLIGFKSAMGCYKLHNLYPYNRQFILDHA